MSGTAEKFTVGIVLYDGCDLLDVAGPNEIFTFLGAFYADLIDLRVVTVAEAPQAPGPSYGFTVNASGVAVSPMFSFQNCPKLDLLFVPGGGAAALQASITDDALLGFLRRQASGARYVTSVCTGGLLLAAAGLLDGYKGTCHWAVVDCLKLFKEVEVPKDYPRWCEDDQRAAGRGIRITGGGISSSIDEALYMVQRVVEDLTGDHDKAVQASRAIQLAIQYHPGPPNTPPAGGDPDSVDPELLQWMTEHMRGFHDPVCQAVRQRIGQG
jgi:cyclohexyl-isocyanide hydratase